MYKRLMNQQGAFRFAGLMVLEFTGVLGQLQRAQITAALNQFTPDPINRCSQNYERNRVRIHVNETSSIGQFIQLVHNLSAVINCNMVAWVEIDDAMLGYVGFEFPDWVTPERQRGFRQRYINTMMRNLRWCVKNQLDHTIDPWKDQS